MGGGQSSVANPVLEYGAASGRNVQYMRLVCHSAGASGGSLGGRGCKTPRSCIEFRPHEWLDSTRVGLFLNC